jgi:diacylglycerol kinase
MARSLGFACEGLVHALLYERNLRLFALGYCLVILIGLELPLLRWEWVALFVSGGAFAVIELFNTALERLTDAMDHLPKETESSAPHRSMKAAKDVAAAASLVGLLTVALTVLLVLGPHVLVRFVVPPLSSLESGLHDITVSSIGPPPDNPAAGRRRPA